MGNQKVTLNHLEFSSGTCFFDLRHNHGLLVRWFQLNLKHIRQTEICSPCWVQHKTSLKPPDRLSIFMHKIHGDGLLDHLTPLKSTPSSWRAQVQLWMTKLTKRTIISHRIHVGYLPAFGWFMVNVGKYTSPMDPTGIPVVWKKTNSPSKASKRWDEKLNKRKWEWGFITLQRGQVIPT